MKLTFTFVGLALFSGAVVAATHASGMSESMPMTMNHSGHQMMDPAQQQKAAQAPISSTVSVSDCWIRSLPEPAPSAGYFIVHNSGKAQVKLKSASSDAYASVMLHQTTHDNGMSKMSMTHDVAIAANGTLAFKPGGFHAMLEKAVKPVVVGTSIPMTFLFDSGEKAQATCEVKPANTLAH